MKSANIAILIMLGASLFLLGRLTRQPESVQVIGDAASQASQATEKQTQEQDYPAPKANPYAEFDDAPAEPNPFDKYDVAPAPPVRYAQPEPDAETQKALREIQQMRRDQQYAATQARSEAALAAMSARHDAAQAAQQARSAASYAAMQVQHDANRAQRDAKRDADYARADAENAARQAQDDARDIANDR